MTVKTTVKSEEITDLVVATRLCTIARNAATRGIEFDLSFSKLKRLLKTKRCFFTGVELDRIEDSPNQMSIDRLDNSKGYIDSNVVVCAREFNQNKKRSLGIEDIKFLYQGLKKAKLL